MSIFEIYSKYSKKTPLENEESKIEHEFNGESTKFTPKMTEKE